MEKKAHYLTEQEEEALSLFRTMSPGQRAMTIGWMSHRANAETRVYQPRNESVV